MRRHRKGLATAVAATWLVAGFGGAAAAETILRIVPQADLRNVDPVWTTAAITQNHGYMVYDMLFALDGDLQPQPQMVDTWSVSDDELTWSFTLRDGLLFHDGSPVEAKDAVASIARWSVKRADGQALMSRTDEMVAIDDKTFEIRLTQPFGPMLQVLANPTLPLPVLREQEALTDPDEQVTTIIGSGPFMFAEDEWVPGDRVVYRKFEDYVPRDEPASGFAGGKVVHVDRVDWIYIPDTNTATQALLTGQVDVYEVPPMDLLPMLDADPNITVAVLDPLGKMGHIRPNHLYPPFNDARARQALQLLVDQREFLAAQVGNPQYEQVCYAVFMCNSVFETDAHAAPWMERDFDRARELLAEAGYDFQQPIVVMLPTDQQIIYNNMLVMVGALQEIGVNVDAQAMDWSTLTTRRARDDDPSTNPNVGWHLFPTWWTGVPMSSPLTNPPLVASGDRATAWFGWPEDEELERLRVSFMDAADFDAQMEVIDAIQERFYEFIPYINTGQFLSPVAWRNEVQDVPDALLFAAWNLTKN